MEFTEYLANHCPVCRHPRRQEITEALQMGTAFEVYSWLREADGSIAVHINDLERHARHARIRSNNGLETRTNLVGQ